MPRRALPHRASPVQLLRALREQPGLVALFGDWLHGDAVIGLRPTRVLEPGEDPFAALGATEDAPVPRTTGGAARFGGGWIGYLGYQLARRLEALPPAPARSGGLPEHHLAHYDHVLVHDAAADRWYCESLPGTDPARVAETVALLERVLAAGGPSTVTATLGEPLATRPLHGGAPPVPGATPLRAGGAPPQPDGAQAAGQAAASSDGSGPRAYRCGPFEAAVTGAAHARAVRRALAHIRDGDVFQANVCRELAAGFRGDPLDLFCAGYERLRPRLAAFVRVPGGAVASLSPELYLRRTGDAVLTSPIKGTAPADTDPRELHASAKNRAENVMIVDLMRNDLSRACVPGSVLSPAVPRVEPHTGVHHLVADVHGTLRPGLDDAALLRSTFPPGSCTGAPKIRATEIINELETTARGAYTGAVGCVSPVAGLVMNVAIRTFEFSDGAVRLGVGGGIVADSDPDGEAFETLVKAAPLLDAVGACFGPELSREWRDHAGHLDVATPACVLGGGAGGARGTVVGSSTSPRPTPRSGAAAALAPDAVAGASVPVAGRTGRAGEVPVLRARPEPSRGVFTTILVREGRPEQLAQHLARLGDSVRACFSRALPGALGERVRARAAALEGPHRLRVTAVPEVTGLRIEISHGPLNPPGAELPVAPWRLVPVVVPGGWGCHKWADRRALDGVPGPWSPVCDPLLVEQDGTVLETGRANVFAVLDGAVVTPPADGRILPGVMRAHVVELLVAAGHRVRERPLGLDDCARATEVFVTNALRGARPVGEIQGVSHWPPGPVTRHLHHLLAGHPHRPSGTTPPA
ncbi:chorismate-binding protein [Kocuria tytonicola]|uniref:chorismate-binding protein n=1 Tax=Kocuria tytonicola TaxID=2055946 RepID=UPI001FB4CC4F|nr:chorismate-binding protein [Kocuria tytonicola]